MTRALSTQASILGLGGAAILCAACQGQDQTALPALPDWSDGYESDCCPGDLNSGTGTGTGTGTTPIPTTEFGLFAPQDVGYLTRVHQTGTTDTPCTTTPGESTADYVALDCTLETNELDLYASGLAYDLTVPEGGCDYIMWSHYQYEAWEVGDGPSTVSITIDADGTIVSETNAIGGMPYCEFDYSYWDNSAPNCCLGSFTIETTDQSTGSTSTTGGGDWGGTASQCYAGAAYIDPDLVVDDNGWPMGTYIFLNRASYYKRFSWGGLSTSFSTNVNLANYFDPADHDGTEPAGYTGDYAAPTYMIGCYDNAEELLARIDLTVREWNEEAQFDADGDPNTTGTEPVTGLPLNDRQDWADATPGSTTWIHDAQ